MRESANLCETAHHSLGTLTILNRPHASGLVMGGGLEIAITRGTHPLLLALSRLPRPPANPDGRTFDERYALPMRRLRAPLRRICAHTEGHGCSTCPLLPHGEDMGLPAMQFDPMSIRKRAAKTAREAERMAGHSGRLSPLEVPLHTFRFGAKTTNAPQWMLDQEPHPPEMSSKDILRRIAAPTQAKVHKSKRFPQVRPPRKDHSRSLRGHSQTSRQKVEPHDTQASWPEMPAPRLLRGSISARQVSELHDQVRMARQSLMQTADPWLTPVRLADVLEMNKDPCRSQQNSAQASSQRSSMYSKRDNIEGNNWLPDAVLPRSPRPSSHMSKRLRRISTLSIGRSPRLSIVSMHSQRHPSQPSPMVTPRGSLSLTMQESLHLLEEQARTQEHQAMLLMFRYRTTWSYWKEFGNKKRSQKVWTQIAPRKVFWAFREWRGLHIKLRQEHIAHQVLQRMIQRHLGEMWRYWYKSSMNYREQMRLINRVVFRFQTHILRSMIMKWKRFATQRKRMKKVSLQAVMHDAVSSQSSQIDEQKVAELHAMFPRTKVSAECAMIVHNLADMFAAVDVSGSGSLAKSDLIVIVRNFLGERVRLAEVKKKVGPIMQAWDVDGNGTLEFPELVNMLLCDDQFKIPLDSRLQSELMLFMNQEEPEVINGQLCAPGDHSSEEQLENDICLDVEPTMRRLGADMAAAANPQVTIKITSPRTSSQRHMTQKSMKGLLMRGPSHRKMR